MRKTERLRLLGQVSGGLAHQLRNGVTGARLAVPNGNAAPAEGDTASPHLTGQAVDLAKHGLTITQIAWLRGYLLPLVQQGKVDVEEEFKQACFHISVYKKYLPPGSVPRRNLASSHRAESSALATAVQ